MSECVCACGRSQKEAVANGGELVEGEHAVAVAVGLDEDAVDEALQLEVGDARDEHAAHAVRVRVRDEAVAVVVKHVECDCVAP